MRFVHIGTKADHVLAVGEIARLPIGLAEAHVIGGALVRRAQRAMVEEGRRSDGVQKSRHLLSDARAPNLD